LEVATTRKIKAPSSQPPKSTLLPSTKTSSSPGTRPTHGPQPPPQRSQTPKPTKPPQSAVTPYKVWQPRTEYIPEEVILHNQGAQPPALAYQPPSTGALAPSQTDQAISAKPPGVRNQAPLPAEKIPEAGKQEVPQASPPQRFDGTGKHDCYDPDQSKVHAKSFELKEELTLSSDGVDELLQCTGHLYHAGH
jgi:hypothetical protein